MRVIGFVLLSLAIVGFLLTLGTLDNRMASLIGNGTRGFFYVMSQGQAFGGSVPMGLATAAYATTALVGVGLLIFGGKRQPQGS